MEGIPARGDSKYQSPAMGTSSLCQGPAWLSLEDRSGCLVAGLCKRTQG